MDRVFWYNLDEETKRVYFFGGEFPVLADKEIEWRFREVEKAIVDYFEMTWRELDGLHRWRGSIDAKVEYLDKSVTEILGHIQRQLNALSLAINLLLRSHPSLWKLYEKELKKLKEG